MGISLVFVDTLYLGVVRGFKQEFLGDIQGAVRVGIWGKMPWFCGSRCALIRATGRFDCDRVVEREALLECFHFDKNVWLIEY